MKEAPRIGRLPTRKQRELEEAIEVSRAHGYAAALEFLRLKGWSKEALDEFARKPFYVESDNALR